MVIAATARAVLEPGDSSPPSPTSDIQIHTASWKETAIIPGTNVSACRSWSFQRSEQLPS